MYMDEPSLVAAGVSPEPGIPPGGNTTYPLHYNHPLMGFTTHSFRAAGRAPSTSSETPDSTSLHA